MPDIRRSGRTALFLFAFLAALPLFAQVEREKKPVSAEEDVTPPKESAESQGCRIEVGRSAV